MIVLPLLFLGGYHLFNTVSDFVESARREIISVSILVDFLKADTEAAEITIDKTHIGTQSPGTLQAYSIQLPAGSNTIMFSVGNKSESREFLASETDEYYFFTLEERRRFIRSDILVITYNGLITSSDVEQLLYDRE
jgi:hypothetical protein